MKDMELKGFDELNESEERSVQGGFWNHPIVWSRPICGWDKYYLLR
jgi:hypothetical protein